MCVRKRKFLPKYVCALACVCGGNVFMQLRVHMLAFCMHTHSKSGLKERWGLPHLVKILHMHCFSPWVLLLHFWADCNCLKSIKYGGRERDSARGKKNGGEGKYPAILVVISCFKTKGKLFWQYGCIFSLCVCVFQNSKPILLKERGTKTRGKRGSGESGVCWTGTNSSLSMALSLGLEPRTEARRRVRLGVGGNESGECGV